MKRRLARFAKQKVPVPFSTNDERSFFFTHLFPSVFFSSGGVS
jgi:hypothetical protein